jgi:O-antigen ligase/tetratricopeptide (TPR) repeat protein
MGQNVLFLDRLRPVSEAIILAMACLSPWAIGAVDAWAQLALSGSLVLLALLQLLSGQRSDWARQLFCVPSLALAGLALWALAQAAPLPAAVERTLAPATRAWRSSLVPEGPQSVRGDSGRSVSPTARTLSHDPDASLRTAAQLAASWLLFQMVLGAGAGYQPFRRFALFTAANASVMTIFAIAQALSWNGKIYGVRPVLGSSWFVGGPFVSHNHLAAYLNLAFGLSLGLFVATIQTARRSRPGRRLSHEALWAGSAAGLVFAGILASHSRGGFLAAVISATATLVFLRPRSVRVGATLAVMAIVAALFLLVMGSTSPLERLATLTDVHDEGITSRTQVWGIALRTWWSSPVWGTGLGSFPAATGAYYRHGFRGSYFSHAESEYLHILTEGGLVGIALALVAAVAIARLGRRALDADSSGQERALVLGALGSGLALLLQCLSDFPLHIPGVTISAVVIAGHLCRLGLEASRSEHTTEAEARPPRWAPLAVTAGMVVLSGVVVWSGLPLARAEAMVRGVGLPFPGALMPTVDSARASALELGQTRAALEAALRLRPNWAEGHLRLGAVLIGLYSNRAQEWVQELQDEKDPETTAILSDPLWLHRVVHSATPAQLAEVGGVLNQEPVHDFLVPAARCFLEARRSSPDLGPAHARLAELDYLIEAGEPASVHAARALGRSGYDNRVLILAGQAAAQAGALDVAAQCWQKALTIHPGQWTEIVLAAALLMTPEQILQKVLPPGGRFPLLVADRLYGAPESRAVRETFLKASAARAAGDPTLSPAERLWVEGAARAGLGERDPARKLMTDALIADPSHPEWRAELIDQLVAWGDTAEATRQGRIGLTLHPDDPGIQRALKGALDQYAKGDRSTALPLFHRDPTGGVAPVQ